MNSNGILIHGVDIDGTRYEPLPQDHVLPPLVVGIYTCNGRLVDVHQFPDPRAKLCEEDRKWREKHHMTAPLIAWPLVAVEKRTPKRAGKTKRRRNA